MPFDPNSMTLIIAKDLDSRVGDKLKMQVAADVMTTEEMEEAMKRVAVEEQVDNEIDNEDTATTEDGELPTNPDLSDAEETAKEADAESGEGDGSDSEADDTNKEGEDSADQKPAEETKDDLDEPNAAFEHAVAAGSTELGYYYAKGANAYKKRVRKNRLATETAQMTVARRQELIRRLMYVKPADTGFTSKLQRQIQLIEDPSKVYALVDEEGIITGQQRYEYESVVNALKEAGVEVFGTVEQLADTINDLQTKIAEA